MGLLPGVGIEAYYNFSLYKKFRNNVALGFQQKGYKEIAQTGLIGPGGTPISHNILSNRINVITLSNDIELGLALSKSLTFLPYWGLELNTLVSTNLESERVWPVYETYPVKNYQDNWESFYLNYIFGTRVKIKNLISVEAGFSRSLTPVMKLNDLMIKDWIWNLKLGIEVSELLRKKVSDDNPT